MPQPANSEYDAVLFTPKPSGTRLNAIERDIKFSDCGIFDGGVIHSETLWDVTECNWT
jgi:hypothetical protein